jgi:GntR family transcriptional regulator
MDDAVGHLFSSSTATGGGPLYLKLKKNIETAIRDGVLKPGDALPSERDIAVLADVSRVTVRKAVQSLVGEGLLHQRHGSGTFVSAPAPRVEQSLSLLTSFTEDMARRGMSLESVFLDRGIYAPAPDETMILGLSAGESVARVARLRIANGAPLAIERAALSAEVLPDPGAVETSLYAVLEREVCGRCARSSASLPGCSTKATRRCSACRRIRPA